MIAMWKLLLDRGFGDGMNRADKRNRHAITSGVAWGDHHTIAREVENDRVDIGVVKRMRYQEINLETRQRYSEPVRHGHVWSWTCDSPFLQIADYFSPPTALPPVGVQGDNHLG
jgi:hypothetical protein